MFPKLKKLSGFPNTFINQLKLRDNELLSYISDRIYEGYDFKIIQSNLDSILGINFSSNKQQLKWFYNTYIDAENINEYQQIIAIK